MAKQVSASSGNKGENFGADAEEPRISGKKIQKMSDDQIYFQVHSHFSVIAEFSPFPEIDVVPPIQSDNIKEAGEDLKVMLEDVLRRNGDLEHLNRVVRAERR